MSQAGYIKGNLPPHPVGVVETLTGNAGGAVGPNILNNINIVGTNPITVTGTPLTNTETITIATATTAQIGATTLATDAETTAGAVSTHAVTPTSLAAKLGTQTANAIAYGGGAANAIDWTAAGTNGQVLLAATAGAPAFATLTSSGGTITFSPGANTLNLEAVVPASGTYPTDSGTATPLLGVLNIKTQNATKGCGSTILFSAPGPANTVQLNVSNANDSIFLGNNAGNLAGTSAYTVGIGNDVMRVATAAHFCVGAGYRALFNASSCLNNNAIGAYSLLALTTGSSNTALSYGSLEQLVSGSYNIAAGGSATDFAGYNYTGAESSNIVLSNLGVTGESNTIRIGTQGAGHAQQNTCYVAGITGVNVGSVATVVSIATGTGQLGSTTITAGTGISVTAGANTITIASTAGSFAWSREAGAAIPMVAGHGYINTNAGLTILTLPALAAVGDTFAVMGESAAGWAIAQNAGQNIQFGSLSSIVGAGGSLASTNSYDTISLVCRVANITFQVISAVGNITIV